MVRNMRPGPNWIPGKVIQKLGPVTYLVDTFGNHPWKCHLDQLKERLQNEGTGPPVVPRPVSQPDLEIDFNLPGLVDGAGLPDDIPTLGLGSQHLPSHQLLSRLEPFLQWNHVIRPDIATFQTILVFD